MPGGNPVSAHRERLAPVLIVLGLLIVLAAGLESLNRDLAYQPLLLALLLSVNLYQLWLRPRAAVFAAALILLVPGLFLYFHYYSAVALVPAFALVGKFTLSACLYRALCFLLAAALLPRGARRRQELQPPGYLRHLRHLRLLAALALPPLAAYLLPGMSLLFPAALTLFCAVLTIYLQRVKKHD
jgi:hypothetical protein